MTGPNTRRGVADATPFLIALDRDADAPLHRQIYGGLRAAILDGRFANNARLPSTRELASDLGVARNTVVLAFEQLRAEGYLAGARGGGSRVRAQVPDSLLNVSVVRPAPRRTTSVRNEERLEGRPAENHEAGTPSLSSRWARVLEHGDGWRPKADVPPIAFALGIPAIDAFPAALWARLTARRWRTGDVFLGHAAATGDRTLREVISAYVSSARGARCSPEQVIIVSGAQQALDLAARVLVDAGDSVLMEDPGYLGARAAFVAAGARVVSVDVDDEGLNIGAGARRAPRARLAYVTPSHQFPLGSVMSASRRLELLAWARRSSAWIVEDDYDSEYRYEGQPIPCLQGLDAQQSPTRRVLYVGTFSKTLTPALRLGYLIVPIELIEAFRAACAVTSGHAPTIDQRVLAEFMGEGHYGRHVRRVRVLCAQRQHALLVVAERELGEHLDLSPDAAGLHLVGWLRGRTSDADVAAAAKSAGLDVSPLSRFSSRERRRGALLLGYAAFDERAIRAGVKRLAKILSEVAKLSRTQRRSSVPNL